MVVKDVELSPLPSRGSDESTVYDPETESFMDIEDGLRKRPTKTPLPVRELAALCGVRLVDPIAFTQVFPYVNEMIDDLHLTDDPSRIGFYSGLVVSFTWMLSGLCG